MRPSTIAVAVVFAVAVAAQVTDYLTSWFTLSTPPKYVLLSLGAVR
jgi:hypothetical protein